MAARSIHAVVFRSVGLFGPVATRGMPPRIVTDPGRAANNTIADDSGCLGCLECSDFDNIIARAIWTIDDVVINPHFRTI